MPWSTAFFYASSSSGPAVGVTSVESDTYQSTETKAFEHFEKPPGSLLCSARKKKNTKTSTTPTGFSVSSLPRTRLLLLIASLAGCKYTGMSLQELTLSEVKWVWIRHSALNQIACEASSPQGKKGKERSMELKKNMSFWFFFDSSQWSLITNWQRLLIKKVQKEKENTWKNH